MLNYSPFNQHITPSPRGGTGWGLPGWGLPGLSGLLFLLFMLFSACTSSDYDTGDGKYSYLIGEFGHVYTNNEAKITRLVTDQGDEVPFAQPVERDWAATPDSLYRAYVQYERKADSKGCYRMFNVAQVLVLNPYDRDELKEEPKFDPVGWESMWVSSDHRYLNLSLQLMFGTTDEEKLLQRIGLLRTSTVNRDDGTSELNLQLYHDQNGVPQYYTSTVYVSIPLDGLNEGDELVLTVNTYQGEVTRRYTISP